MNNQVSKKFRSDESAQTYLNQITKSDYGYYTKVSTDDVFFGLSDHGKWGVFYTYPGYRYDGNANRYLLPTSKKILIKGKGVEEISKASFLALALSVGINSILAIAGAANSNFLLIVPFILTILYLVTPLPFAIKPRNEIITIDEHSILVINKKWNKTETTLYGFQYDPTHKLDEYFKSIVREGAIENNDQTPSDGNPLDPDLSHKEEIIYDDDMYDFEDIYDYVSDQSMRRRKTI